MPQILVTGSKGQVGQELQQLAKSYADFSFIFTDVEELDITDLSAIRQLFQNNNFNYCINCAAYTAVDKAETNEAIAKKINVEGAKNLATICKEFDAIPFFHISTDYVYHNSQNTPFKEGDKENPQGVYAATKLKGDQAALSVHSSTIVLRTSWVYSSFGHNFVKTMLRLGQEREKLTIIFDQIGTPTYAYDLAKAILDIIQQVEVGTTSQDLLQGVYHYSNEGVASWYDFAQAIFAIRNINCAVLPIETKDYPTPAKRPPFSLLNKAKFKTTFGLSIPYWRDSLETCLERL